GVVARRRERDLRREERALEEHDDRPSGRRRRPDRELEVDLASREARVHRDRLLGARQARPYARTARGGGIVRTPSGGTVAVSGGAAVTARRRDGRLAAGPRVLAV